MNVVLRFMKRAEKTTNKIRIPKFIIEKYGRDFYFEILEDETIRLVPIKKGE